MCEQILKSDLHFPPGCEASADARDFIRSLLMRDPASRLGSRAGGVSEIKGHPFFKGEATMQGFRVRATAKCVRLSIAGIDWEKLEAKAIEPLFKPKVDSDTDIGNFDASFTSEPAVLTPPAPSELVRSFATRGRLIRLSLRLKRHYSRKLRDLERAMNSRISRSSTLPSSARRSLGSAAPLLRRGPKRRQKNQSDQNQGLRWTQLLQRICRGTWRRSKLLRLLRPLQAQAQLRHQFHEPQASFELRPCVRVCSCVRVWVIFIVVF